MIYLWRWILLEIARWQTSHGGRMIITIANQKGGVGKTTTAVTLAHGLAIHTRQPVLLLDLDPQGQAARLLGLEPGPGAFEWLASDRPLTAARTTARPNLDLITSNKRTAIIADLWRQDGAALHHLRRLLTTRANPYYRYTIIDTAPTLGDLQRQALYACDAVLVPSTVDYLGLDGAAAITNTLLGLQEHGWPGALLGILPTMHDETTRESMTNLAEYRKIYGPDVLNPIHRSTVLRETAAEGITIWERRNTESARRAMLEYMALVTHVAQVC